MGNREGDIQLYCLRYLKAKGYYFGRVNTGGIKRGNVWCKNPYTMRGMCDILVFDEKNKILVALEVKSSRGTLSTEQELFKKNWTTCGGKYIVVRDMGDIEKVL